MVDSNQRLLKKFFESTDINAVIQTKEFEDRVNTFQQSNCLVLPDLVLEYFRRIPLNKEDNFDGDLFCFWPLTKVERVGVTWRCGSLQSNANAELFVFADYCISAWEYAMHLNANNDNAAPVVMISGSDTDPPHQIAASFEEFLSIFIDDPDKLL